MPKFKEVEADVKKAAADADFSRLEQLIAENAPAALNRAKSRFTPKTLLEHRLKTTLPWHAGGWQCSIDSMRASALGEERYCMESELLSARHPRRVERLLADMQPMLEKRYGTKIQRREKLIMMEGLYTLKTRLEEKMGKLDEARAVNANMSGYSTFDEGWATIARMWHEHYYRPAVLNAAEAMLSLFIGLRNPGRMIRKDTSEYMGPATSLCELGEDRSIWRQSLEMYTAVLREDFEQGLSFNTALRLKHKNLAEKMGLDIPRSLRVNHSHPEIIDEKARAALARHYKERTPEATHFIDWFKRIALQRWHAVAEDCNRVFDSHSPDPQDRHMAAQFHSLRTGEEVHYKDEIAWKGMPGVIRQLEDDGFISQEDMVSTRVRRVKSVEDLPFTYGKRTLAPLSLARLLPIDLSMGDLGELSMHLEPGNYKILFKGSSVAVLGKMGTYPNGSSRIECFYSISGSGSGASSSAMIGGMSHAISRFEMIDGNSKIDELMFDADTDVVPVKAYTVVLKATPQEFASHYRDFLAHAMMLRPHIDAEAFEHDFSVIGKLPLIGLSMGMGICGHLELKTFEHSGRFAFQIVSDTPMRQDNVVYAGSVLTAFVKNAGFSFWHETSLDEYGRSVVKHKEQAREFAQANLDDIVAQLQGDGLARVLTHALNDREYSLWNFQVADNPCEECGRPYMAGLLYRPSKGEQWIDGVGANQLHELAFHPHTFTNNGKHLVQIDELVKAAAKDDPVFLRYRAIMPALTEFASVYESYLKAKGEAYGFWFDTQGGIRAEEEELEDDPELRRLSEEEHNLNIQAAKTRTLALEKARQLEEAYMSVSGQRRELEDTALLNQWSRTLMVHNIYLASAPRLLEERTGIKLPIVNIRFS